MDWLEEVFKKQRYLQQELYKTNDLVDIEKAFHAATGAMIEIGEMLQEDTRWKKPIYKNNKVPVYSLEGFTEELIDAMIYLINVAIFYGISPATLKQTMLQKIDKNYKRLLKEVVCK